MSGSRSALSDWQGFFLARSHVLRRYPGLLFQEAINEPDASPQAMAAAAALSGGREARPFIRWLNKPQSAPRCLLTLAGHRDRVETCAFSPDGASLVSGSWDGTLKFWDARTGRELAVHDGSLLAVSPDGTAAVSQSSDNAVTLWDLPAGRALRTVRGAWGRISSASFSADAERLLFGTTDGVLAVWDLAAGYDPSLFPRQERGLSVCAFSPDGSRLISRTEEGPSRLWHAGSRVLIAEWPNEMVKDVWAFSPDGSFLVVSSGSVALLICDTRTGRLRDTLRHDKDSMITACAVSPDGARIAAGDMYCHPKVWNASTGQEVATLSPDRQTRAYEESSFSVEACAFSPDGSRLVTLSSNGYLVLWEPAGGNDGLTLIPPLEGVGFDTCFTFTPDGSAILAPDYRRPGTLGLYEVATGRDRGSLGGHIGEIRCSSFSADGSRLATGSDDGTIKIWDAAGLAALSRLAGHEDAVSTCEFSPDGAVVVTGSKDGTLRVWDRLSGRELAMMDLKPKVRAGLSDRIEYARDESSRIRVSSSPDDLARLLAAVKRCRFSADGRRVISVSENGDQRTWDAESGLEIGGPGAGADPEAGEAAAMAAPPGLGGGEGGPWGRRLTLEHPARRKWLKKSDKPTAAQHEVWVAEGGREIARFADVMGEVTVCAVSPVDSGFVAGDELGSVMVLRLENVPAE